jgi:hypothetical protein
MMKKFLDNIINTKLGRILDLLFLGSFLRIHKFVLYLFVPSLIFSFMQYFCNLGINDHFMMVLTLILLPIFIIGAFWFVYRTTRLD